MLIDRKSMAWSVTLAQVKLTGTPCHGDTDTCCYKEPSLSAPADDLCDKKGWTLDRWEKRCVQRRGLPFEPPPRGGATSLPIIRQKSRTPPKPTSRAVREQYTAPKAPTVGRSLPEPNRNNKSPNYKPA